VQNQQVAAHPQAAYQEQVQPVTKVQYSCGEIAIFFIFPNVKIRGEINIHAAARMDLTSSKGIKRRIILCSFT
jgi:hypothetical protein